MPLIVWVTNYHMNTDCCTPGSNKNQKEKSKKDKKLENNVSGCSSYGWERIYRWNKKGKILSQLWDTKPEDSRWVWFQFWKKHNLFFSREEGATSDCGHQLHRLLWSRFDVLFSDLTMEKLSTLTMWCFMWFLYFCMTGPVLLLIRTRMTIWSSFFNGLGFIEK